MALQCHSLFFVFGHRGYRFVMITSLSDISLIAILRGVHPHEVLDIAKAIYDAGWNCIEIPLNSPSPFHSLEILQNHFGDTCLIGAGTVLTRQDVQNVCAVGAKLIVSPNCNADIIDETKRLNMFSIAGIFTPTEAFHALASGADALKLFPGEIMIPFYVKAIRAVLPKKAVSILQGALESIICKNFILLEQMVLVLVDFFINHKIQQKTLEYVQKIL